MSTPLAQPPKKTDSRFDEWVFRLWKRLTRTNSAELGLGTMADQDADAVAITGGTIDNAVIGGTTKAAGSFTTVTATSTVTLSGTAANIATGANFISYGGTDAGLSFDSANNATLSGYIGIGVSPTYQLDVRSALTGTTAGSNRIVTISSNASGRDAHIGLGDNVNPSAQIGYLSGDLYFRTNSTERMRLDIYGNLGIGATPKVWLSSWKALNIAGPGASIASNGSNRIQIGTNHYLESTGANWLYTTSSNPATQYTQIAGVHEFYCAPSGTADTAITFTKVLAVEKDKSLALQGASSQTGTGITFPATQSASTNANTLDDYEEGTFTPLLVGSTSGAVALAGKYRKVGDMVTCWITSAAAITAGTLVGNLSITGLPFTFQGPYGDARDTMMIPIPWIRGSSDTTANIRFGAINNGATSIQLFSASTFGDTTYYPGASSNFPAANITQNGTTAVYMCLSFSYLYQ